MSASEELPVAERATNRRVRRNGALSRLWRKVRQPLADSGLVKGMLASLVAAFMRLIMRTNRPAAGSIDLEEVFRANPRTIYALWHGQHLLAPAFNPPWHDISAMFSRSADAELNALVAERFGMKTVRGSGGRDREKAHEKGGARALIALKKALDRGSSVAMIADIPHGTPREAGLGIVTLARISGRPIVGIAIATSRRKVLEKSWDKTTINLPFGRRGVVTTEPLSVPTGADEAMMEQCRAQLTARMNDATEAAYRLADGQR